MGWLDGTVAIVTGGESGIGRAVVLRYLDEGAAGVVVVDRNADGLATLKAQHPKQIATVTGDVRDYTTHAQAVALALKTFGKLDTLVGNAGVFDFHRPLKGYTPETLAATFEEIFAINLRGYLYAAHAAHEALIASRGSMIFTASVASAHARGGGMLYVASKHAVLGLVRRLALELAPEVRVNAVAPGGTLTQLSGSAALGQSARSLADDHAALEAKMAASVPLGFAQQSSDHAGAYVLLASRANAAAITGEDPVIQPEVQVFKHPNERGAEIP